ncbi:MAG: AMP-binding protein, partial [bacterium]|nr:AMP-binding protein [bacterium]
DPHLHPVPPGVPGEICLSGPGLARGYFRRPELTAASFLPDPLSGDPFGAEPGARLYRTGDLARVLADGNVEFMGRIDLQVKIRGFRIELGEIETVLGWHPGVREAVVVAREDGPGARRLVAYAVRGREAAELDAGALRAHLGENLPDYMVPAAIVFLEALPRTPGGKVDRRALPAPEPGIGAPAGGRAAPRNPVEEILAGIWSQVLGGVQVGVDDDFFALGGHSLLATQVQSRIRRDLRVELPLRTLFERPTVAALAEWVATALRREEDPEVPPIRPLERHRPPPLSFAQQRLWFLDQFEPGSALYNLPTILRLRGRLDPGALVRALGEIVRRHEVLRTTFEAVDGKPVQMIRPLPEPALPLRDLTRLREPRREAEADRLARADARQSFDLARGPLLRVTLLRLGLGTPDREEHTLLLTLHHIVFDGWSVGVFLHELTAFYQAFIAGRSPHTVLPELPVQYADFAVWQRQWLREEVLERELAYWREQLVGLPVVELPTDRPRPAVQSFRGASEVFRLPAELAGRLQELSRQQGSTLFMTLLAAFQALLGRYTGQRDVAVGSPIANRNRAEIEGLLGFFVNTLVLRSDLSDAPTFRELVARVRDVALGAYAHQDLPFEKLVEELEPERNLSHNPLMQVLFVLQNAPVAPEARSNTTIASPELAPGLRVELGGVASDQAKFDLTLALQEDEAGLIGEVEYNTDLFDATTIRRLVGHYRTLLEDVAADPERRVAELRWLSPPEEQQLLREWSGAAYPREAAVHELFTARTAKSPEAVALILGVADEHLSYRELDRRANRLAHLLRGCGVGPEVCVGLCL